MPDIQGSSRWVTGRKPVREPPAKFSVAVSTRQPLRDYLCAARTIYGHERLSPVSYPRLGTTCRIDVVVPRVVECGAPWGSVCGGIATVKSKDMLL
jgi:hypothetical protein